MASIFYGEIPTPLGNMQVGISDKGICMFEFPIEERIIQHKMKFSEIYSETEIVPTLIFNQLKDQIDDYFNGNRTDFDLPLDLVGTDFQCRVWESLRTVPYGKTMSYLELAENLNNPKGVRAVAQANGQNRIPIIIPCHRIISANGKLTGYSGELWRKELLLSKESGQNRLIF